MDEVDFLPVEAVAKHIVLRPLAAVHAARAESEFGIDIEVTNTGPNILTWDAQHPVALSYRWIDMATGAHFPVEGSRADFEGPLRPNSAQILHLTIKPPSFNGLVTLRISCVCEGRFWFYERFPTVCTDLSVNVDFLPVEAVAEHIVLRPLTAVHSARAESEFGIDIEVTNTGPNILTWDAQHPVALSYRWIDMATGAHFPVEGSRADFEGPLRPNSAQILHLTIKPPSFNGLVTLRISCVCEGRFWFYERFPTVCTDLSVSVVDLTVWPIELRGSFASRALRGAVAANALRQTLIADPIQCMVSLPADEPAPDPVTPPEADPPFLAFTAAPAVELLPGPLDAFPPCLWPMQAEVVPAPYIEGWKVWFRHPIMTLGRYIDQTLIKSSLGRGLEATQVATGNLLERLRQSAQNDLHTQAMLRDMLGHQERRDAYYAQAHYDHIGFLQQDLSALRQELGALIRQEAQAVKKFIVQEYHDREQEFLDREQMHATERHETSAKMLRSIVEASRRTQLGLLKLGDEMGRMHNAQKVVATEINAAVREVQSETLSRIASQESLTPQIDEIADALQQVTLSNAQELADLRRLGDKLASISDFFRTDFGYIFAKIDALLHRQNLSAPALNKTICRNALGLFAIPETDLETISYYASGLLPEPGSLALVQKLLKPGDTFVDVGANVGLFSVAAGRQIGPTGSILSFEPAPETMSALTATMRLNGLSSIATLHQSAAGRENGTAKLNVGRICGHSSLLPLEEKREVIDVSVVVLDDIIGDRKVDLIKIDVEGWELEVLEGLRKTLANNRDASVLLEFGPSHLKRAGSDPLTWVSTLRTFGMNIYEINEDDVSLTPFRSEGFENIASINLLLSRRLENLVGRG